MEPVGAGDAFGAALLRWLWVNNRLGADPVERLEADELDDALAFAAAVGALQCARAGASPPSLEEVEAFAAR